MPENNSGGITISGSAILKLIIIVLLIINIAISFGNSTTLNDLRGDLNTQEARFEWFLETIGLTESTTPTQAERVDIDVGNSPTLGPEDAPVMMVVFSEAQCPYCNVGYQTEQQLKEQYGDDIYWVYKHYPLSFHENAMPTAIAMECAHRQGKFWEYHDIAYEHNTELSADNLKEYAEQIGLDTEEFNTCFDNEETKDIIESDSLYAVGLGIGGVPAYFINGILVEGAAPIANFQQIINEELGA